MSLVTSRNEPPQEHAEKIRTIILRVAYLLQHLQSKFKFMHNDLKPNNVMYVQDQEMKVYLIDFGSSSIEDKDGRRFFAANTDFEEAGFLRNEFHEGLDLFMLIMGFLQGYWLHTADSARPAWLEKFAVVAESHLYDHADWKGWWVQKMGGRNPSLIETESWRIGYDKDLTSSHAKMLDEFTPSKVIEALSPRAESQKTTEQPALPATTDVDTTESPTGQDRETVLTKRSLMIHPEVDVIGVDQGLQPCFAVLDHRQVLSRKGTKRCPKAWQEALSGFDPEEIVRVLNGLIKDGHDTTSSSETLEQSSLGNGQKIHWTPEATSDGPEKFNQDTRLLGHKVPLQTSIRFNMKMAQEMMRTSTSQKEFAARSDFARSEFVRQALGSTVAQTYMDLRSWVRSYSAQSRAKTLDPCLKHYSKKTIGFQQDSRTVVDLSMTLDRFIDHQSVATAASSSEAVSSKRDGRSALRHLMIKQCLPRPTDSKFEARANFFDKLSELRFQVLSIRPSVAAFATKGPPKSRLSLGSEKVKLGALFEDQDVESVDFLRDDGQKDRAHPTPAHGTHFPVEFMDRVVDHTRNMVFLRPSSSNSRFPNALGTVSLACDARTETIRMSKPVVTLEDLNKERVETCLRAAQDAMRSASQIATSKQLRVESGRVIGTDGSSFCIATQLAELQHQNMEVRLIEVEGQPHLLQCQFKADEGANFEIWRNSAKTMINKMISAARAIPRGDTIAIGLQSQDGERSVNSIARFASSGDLRVSLTNTLLTMSINADTKGIVDMLPRVFVVKKPSRTSSLRSMQLHYRLHDLVTDVGQVQQNRLYFSNPLNDSDAAGIVELVPKTELTNDRFRMPKKLCSGVPMAGSRYVVHSSRPKLPKAIVFVMDRNSDSAYYEWRVESSEPVETIVMQSLVLEPKKSTFGNFSSWSMGSDQNLELQSEVTISTAAKDLGETTATFPAATSIQVPVSLVNQSTTMEDLERMHEPDVLRRAFRLMTEEVTGVCWKRDCLQVDARLRMNPSNIEKARDIVWQSTLRETPAPSRETPPLQSWTESTRSRTCSTSPKRR